MIVENQTPYPNAEVRRIVTNGFANGGGKMPRKVRVLYRRSKTATNLGFTPYDHSRPIDIWIEPANRYPQPGARSWRDELLTTSLHEAHHFRHPGCRGKQCEVNAERYAQHWRRKLLR